MIDNPRRFKKLRTHSRIVRIADRKVATVGLKNGFWSDIHHRAVTVSWPAFFMAAAAVFMGFNCVFALLYALGNRPIASVEPGDFLGRIL